MLLETQVTKKMVAAAESKEFTLVRLIIANIAQLKLDIFFFLFLDPTPYKPTLLRIILMPDVETHAFNQSHKLL